jgi:hypothetical protein
MTETFLCACSCFDLGPLVLRSVLCLIYSNAVAPPRLMQRKDVNLFLIGNTRQLRPLARYGDGEGQWRRKLRLVASTLTRLTTRLLYLWD